MSRKTKALVDLTALANNYAKAAACAPASKTMAVVKANAYGHGIAKVVAALSHAPGFAVATIDEAIELRDHTDKPILILQGVFRADELLQTQQLNLTPTIHTEQQLQLYCENPNKAPDSSWMIIDTGMSRLGFKEKEIKSALEKLLSLSVIKDLVICTHMANASSPDLVSNQKQLALISKLKTRYPNLEYSLANSAATLSNNQYHLDWNRVGIMLYGGSPFDDINHPDTLALEPVMTLISEVIALRDLIPGESVGYGSTWTAEKPSRIATIAVGYADGYPRHVPTGTPVYIRGDRHPTVGRVSMDMIMVDVSENKAIQVGDEVELFGSHISINEIALAADTISYEIMTSISPRVPRYYSN